MWSPPAADCTPLRPTDRSTQCLEPDFGSPIPVGRSARCRDTDQAPRTARRQATGRLRSLTKSAEESGRRQTPCSLSPVVGTTPSTKSVPIGSQLRRGECEPFWQSRTGHGERTARPLRSIISALDRREAREQSRRTPELGSRPSGMTAAHTRVYGRSFASTALDNHRLHCLLCH